MLPIPGSEIVGELHLVMHKNGQLGISGNLMDKPICTWMLLNAIDYVKAFNPQKQRTIPIIKPTNGHELI